jgi:hypothetical protein
MLRDNLVGLIEPMPTARESGSSFALDIHKQRQASDDRSSCLENPRPAGAESSLTERTSLHFRLNQDKRPSYTPGILRDSPSCAALQVDLGL